MKTLKLNKLKIGMDVSVNKLAQIRDTLIILEMEDYNTNYGKIAFIGKHGKRHKKKTQKIIQKIIESGKVAIPVYNDSNLIYDMVVIWL